MEPEASCPSIGSCFVFIQDIACVTNTTLQIWRVVQPVNESSNLESFINLLGAFEYDGRLIPVEFGLKKSKDNSQRVYIVATIKEDPLNAPTAKGGHGAKAGSSYAVSIEDVIGNVKSEDGYILSSIPSKFLTEEQLAGKRKGLSEHGDQLWMKAAGYNKNADAPVNMTSERIDSAIKKYDGKAYMTYINPAEFVDLSTADPDGIDNESRQLTNTTLQIWRVVQLMPRFRLPWSLFRSF